MPGAILQLAAYGVQNIYLTGNPQITFYVMVYKRHTNFAIECYEQLFTGEPDFGKRFFCNLERIGDLIGEIYLDVKLPSLTGDRENGADGTYLSWVNGIGNALILNIEMEIGGEIIEKHYGQWLDIWNELTLPAEKKLVYNSMIGKHENFNATTQGGAMHLRVPLTFWFCRNKGLMLPLIALQNSEVRINFEFRKFNELWISSDADYEFGVDDVKHVEHASLMVDYVFLEDEERRFFAKNPHFYLIEKLQLHSEALLSEKSDNIINLDQFNHPVKELIWVIQNSTILEKYAHGGNEWFNYSDRPYGLTTGPAIGSNASDNMTSAVLQINGQDRFKRRDAEYFRMMQPYKYHTSVPNNFIYVYSFGFCPEELQPSGTCNFSRIDNATLNVDIINDLSQPVIFIYAPCYNILEISGGLVGIKYND